MPSPLATPWSRREYVVAPEPVTGWELDPERGWFSVVVPEQVDTVNLITNPSFEVDTTNWTAATGSIARATTQQRRGAYGLTVTPAAGAALAYYGGTTPLSTSSATWYAFSLDLRGTPGSVYRIYFATTAGAQLGGYTEVRGKDYWERIHVLYYETTGASRRVYVEQVSGQSGAFYIDGAQVEANNYTTTYFDGDTVPLVPYLGSFYSWTGVAHASTSTRLAYTPGGGHEVNLLDVGFRIVAAIGLGMMAINNVTTPLSTGGALYQRTLPKEREFALAGSVWGETETEIQVVRQRLVDLFNPLTVPQPVTLRYHQYSDCGNSESEIANIPCVYQSGLEQNMDDTTQERIGIIFKSYLPYVLKEGSNGVALETYETIYDTGPMIYRDVDGAWTNPCASSAYYIYTMTINPIDGYLYAGGTFSQLGGVSAQNLAYWDGTAWHEFNGGVDFTVWDMAFDSTGDLYVVGGYYATNPYIRKWDVGSGTWQTVGTAANQEINAIAIDENDIVYVGGYFTSIGGVAANYVAKWDGANWSAMGTGASHRVRTLYHDPVTSYVYAGGGFTSMGGVANTNMIARWNGTTWESVSGGLNGSTYGTYGVMKFKRSPDGSMYAVGDFYPSSDMSLPTSLAIDTGSDWVGMKVAPYLGTLITDLLFLPSGGLIVVGNNGSGFSFGYWEGATFVTTFGAGIEGMAHWNGTAWYLLDVHVAGGTTPAHVMAIEMDSSGRLYLGQTTYGNTIFSSLTTITNSGSVPSYPTIIITGSLGLSTLTNYTTGRTIFFRSIIIDATERVTLTFAPTGITMMSSTRGDLSSYIASGSNIDFYLQPGANNISFLNRGPLTTGTATMYWTEYYSSLDTLVRRP